MTRYLRVRVGDARCLFPAGMVGTVESPNTVPDAFRTIDARRLAAGDGGGGPHGEAVAVVLAPAGGRRRAAVLVDEVESFVNIDDREFLDVPTALPRLRCLFDGLWHEAGRGSFQPRVGAAAWRSFGERRSVLRAAAPAAPDAGPVQGR